MGKCCLDESGFFASLMVGKKEEDDAYLSFLRGLLWGRPSSASWYDWTWASASAAAFLAASSILLAMFWAVSLALFSEAPSPNDLSYSSTSAAAAKAASLESWALAWAHSGLLGLPQTGIIRKASYGERSRKLIRRFIFVTKP